MQNIIYYIGQVILSHQLLFVSQLTDTLSHLTHRLLIKFHAYGIQIHLNVSLAAVLTQRIFPDTSETLRHEYAAVEIVLAVSIGMDTGTLGKDKLAHHRLVLRDMDAAVHLNQTA